SGRSGSGFSRENSGAPIVYDDLLAQWTRNSLRDDARNEIAATARRRRDDAYGAVRILLPARRTRAQSHGTDDDCSCHETRNSYRHDSSAICDIRSNGFPFSFALREKAGMRERNAMAPSLHYTPSTIGVPLHYVRCMMRRVAGSIASR